jgi:hypothetical protein
MDVVLHDADMCLPQLETQLPLRVRPYRVLPGPDRPDYVLAITTEPIRFAFTAAELAGANIEVSRMDPAMYRIRDDGTVTGVVRCVALCARIRGDAINPSMRDLPVNLAYVMDQTQLEALELSMDNVMYVGIMRATTAPAHASGGVS